LELFNNAYTFHVTTCQMKTETKFPLCCLLARRVIWFKHGSFDSLPERLGSMPSELQISGDMTGSFKIFLNST